MFRTFALKPFQWVLCRVFGDAKGKALMRQIEGPLGDWIVNHTPEEVEQIAVLVDKAAKKI